jgi:TRAP transporter TAXI family solute receptor
MATYLQRERRRRIVFWIAVVVLTGAAAALSYHLTGPPPPRKVRLATGEAGGAYAEFGRRYAEMLGEQGLEVELIETAGGIDNFYRLRDGKADVALVQSGTYDRVEDPDRVVRGIAALGLEPLWVIYRGGDEVTDVTHFRGRKISIGPADSGTELLSRVILEVNGIGDEDATLLHLPTSEAASRLEAGTLDVVFIVSSFKSALIRRLLDNEDLRLMGFRRYSAYVRIFPYLTPVELAEGVLDLEDNVPPEPTALLAPSAMLACRRDTHPRVVEQFITVAREIHSPGSRIARAEQFPTLDGVDLPVHETAEAYVRSGESLISRLVPYWAMHWVVRAQFLILPVLTLWIPFFKILPLLYRYRIGTLLKRHYAALRDVETGIERADSPSELSSAIEALESLRDDMERLSRKIPAYYQQDVYHWRLHVSMVQDEAHKRLGEQKQPTEEEPPSEPSG